MMTFNIKVGEAGLAITQDQVIRLDQTPSFRERVDCRKRLVAQGNSRRFAE